MQTDVNDNEATPALRSRREFFMTSGRVALTAPAVALLLQASAKKAHAKLAYAADGRDYVNDDAGSDDAIIEGDGP